jgi:hypothetical protein
MTEEMERYETQPIEQMIMTIRGQRVILDADLASIYGVPTKRLNEQVRRNTDRFPLDFAFILTDQEVANLRSQFATSKEGRGGRRYPPHAFTEQGVAMLSSVLNSERAIKVNIEIMRAFVRLRQILASNKELAKRLDELEKKYDAQFKVVFDAIRLLLIAQSQKKPLVVIIEDLHWMDKTSEEFLTYLINSLATTRILLIFLFRPEYNPAAWVTKTFYSQIRVDEMTPDTGAEMVRAMLKDLDPRQDYAPVITPRSGRPCRQG